MRSVRCRITGRVQGVWFRGSAQTEACRLGVTGYATNLADGSVEVLAHGDDSAIDQFVAWLQRGPRLARVDAVTVAPAALENSPADFEVR